MAADVHAVVAPVTFHGLKSKHNVVFFGKNLGPHCQRCGAYDQTSMGHRFCGFVACPIALIEFKRRQRRRTSSLEKVYLPKMLVTMRAEPEPHTALTGE